MTLTFEILPVNRDHVHDCRFWKMTDVAKREHARKILAHARAKGLVHGRRCCVCNAENAEGHHDNYDRPYEVAWLCKLHHAARHVESKLGEPTTPRPRVFIPAELRVGPNISRQYRSLLQRKKAGVCVKCEATPLLTKIMCAKCAIATREYQRKRNGCKRANNCVTRSAQQLQKAA